MDTRLMIPPKRYSLIAFFLLAFAIAWGFWIPAALALKGFLSLPFPVTLADLLGVWGPSLAGIVMTVVNDGKGGLRVLFKRLFQWRVGIQWYLFVLLWPPALSLLVTAFSMLLGSPAPDFANPPVTYAYPVPPEALSAGFLPLLPMVFLIQIFGSSMGEELGWRGFALPRLQARQSALLASGILGALWGLWHLPRFWTPGDPFDIAGFGWLMLGLMLNAVLYTWVFNGTTGSLLPVVLFHTAQPVTNLFLAKVPNPPVENALTALLVMPIVVMSAVSHTSRIHFRIERQE
jgi:membrane protease YdiL (CAAX protease family)